MLYRLWPRRAEAPASTWRPASSVRLARDRAVLLDRFDQNKIEHENDAKMYGL